MFLGICRTPEITCSNLSGEPWDIFRLALHLATEDSDVVTGQSFTIAGALEGTTAKGA